MINSFATTTNNSLQHQTTWGQHNHSRSFSTPNSIQKFTLQPLPLDLNFL